MYCSMQIKRLSRNSKNVCSEIFIRGQIKWDKKEKKSSSECSYTLKPVLKWTGKFFILLHCGKGFSPKAPDVSPLNNVNFSSASLHDDWKRSNLTPVAFFSPEEVFLKTYLGELVHRQTLTSLRGGEREERGQTRSGDGGTPWSNKPLKSCPSF